MSKPQIPFWAVDCINNAVGVFLVSGAVLLALLPVGFIVGLWRINHGENK